MSSNTLYDSIYSESRSSPRKNSIVESQGLKKLGQGKNFTYDPTPSPVLGVSFGGEPTPVQAPAPVSGLNLAKGSTLTSVGAPAPASGVNLAKGSIPTPTRASPSSEVNIGEGQKFEFGGSGLLDENLYLQQDQLVSISKFSWKQRQKVLQNETRPANAEEVQKFSGVTELLKRNSNSQNSIDSSFTEKILGDEFKNHRNEISYTRSNSSVQKFGGDKLKNSARNSMYTSTKEMEKEQVIEVFKKCSASILQKEQKSAYSQKQNQSNKQYQDREPKRGVYYEKKQSSNSNVTYSNNNNNNYRQNNSKQTYFVSKNKSQFNQIVRGSFVDNSDSTSLEKEVVQFEVFNKQLKSGSPKKSTKHFNFVKKDKSDFNKVVRGSFTENFESDKNSSNTKNNTKQDKYETFDYNTSSHVGDVQYCQNGQLNIDVINEKTDSIIHKNNKFSSQRQVQNNLEISSPSSDSKADSDEQISETFNSDDSIVQSTSDYQINLFEQRSQQFKTDETDAQQFNKCLREHQREGNVRNGYRYNKISRGKFVNNYKRSDPDVKKQDIQFVRQISEVQKDDYQSDNCDEQFQDGGDEDGWYQQSGIQVFKHSGFDGLESEESMPDFANIMPNTKYAIQI